MKASPPASRPGFARLLFLAACAVVVGTLVGSTESSLLERAGGKPADAYYNLLVEGFRSGHLSLNRPAPPALARLPDPYDPAATAAERVPPFGVHDLSYYRGKLYLYFGVTPALLLFWPYAALTGRYLFHDTAVLIFCLTGFLAAAALLCACWRRSFPAVPAWIAAAGVLALGLATSAPLLLRRAEIWEVPISCAYALLTLALGAVWLALHRPAARGRWLAAAGLACGLAVGARPAALLAVVILVIPIWAERGSPAGRIARLAAAAAIPLLACGLGLALYNYLRFQNAVEFGQHYQLAGDRQDAVRHFSPRYLWYNFRMYFLQPAQWNGSFPFARPAAGPPPPAGHAPAEDPFGILPDIPLALLALAAPLAWGRRRGEAPAGLRAFGAALVLLFVAGVFPLLLFYGACSRYEMEFLPPLIFLAVFGLFGIERALADRPAQRRLVRAGWGLLLAGSIAFNFLAGWDRAATERYRAGNTLVHFGRLPEAAALFESVLRLEPALTAAHNNLGNVLARLGRRTEAREHYEAAARLDPRSADSRYNLGNLLSSLGQPAEAMVQYEAALRLQPDFAEARLNLAVALAGTGRPADAATQFEAAARLRPHSPELFYDWGAALAHAGQLASALARFEEALRLKPDYAEAHNGRGSVLGELGRYREARAEFTEALRLKPDLPRVRENLAQIDALLAHGGGP